MRLTAIGLTAALLTACHQQAAQNQAVPTAAEPPAANVSAPAAAPAPALADTNAAQPDDRTPLSEPQGPIDPKSAEAAGQVVQHYGALIERQRWLKAEKLWGDIDAARAFATTLGGRFGQVHLEIGKLGDTEGAAGSIYLTEPVVFYGQSKAGKDLRLPAEVILRRVNDVDGSTEAQRRWHIARIELKKPA
jgi:hypothetical protein